MITDVNCFGAADGHIELETNNGTAPYSYTWSNGQSNSQISNLTAGDYNYTVVDAQGCEIINMVSVPEPATDLSVIFDVSKVTCGNSQDGAISATVTGGTSPYTFEWSNGESTNVIQNLNPNTYSVIITDSKGCVLNSNNEITIGEKCKPLATYCNPDHIHIFVGIHPAISISELVSARWITPK